MVLTQLCDLTTGMLGTRSHKELKTKGAETKGLLYFIVDLLGESHLQQDVNTQMLSAGQALVRHIEVLKSSAVRKMPTEAVQDRRELKR